MLLTLIARASDGELLSGSIQEAEQVSRNLNEYQNQAKMIFRKLGSNAPTPSTVESGPILFHYIIEGDVCYMALCEKSFSRRLVFSYLDELKQQFAERYAGKIQSVRRPYAFIEFATTIQKIKKPYVDSRVRRNVSRLNEELVDVQRIMVQNIDEVLQRGEHMSSLANKATDLSAQSRTFLKESKYLNLRSTYAKWAALAVILLLFVLFIRFWFL